LKRLRRMSLSQAFRTSSYIGVRPFIDARMCDASRNLYYLVSYRFKNGTEDRADRACQGQVDVSIDVNRRIHTSSVRSSAQLVHQGLTAFRHDSSDMASIPSKRSKDNILSFEPQRKPAVAWSYALFARPRKTAQQA
jgi:hypothetical protein